MPPPKNKKKPKKTTQNKTLTYSAYLLTEEAIHKYFTMRKLCAAASFYVVSFTWMWKQNFWEPCSDSRKHFWLAAELGV